MPTRLIFAVRGVTEAICATEVYIEYAAAENFIIDVSLLYAALKIVRRDIRPPLILISGGAGTAAAIVFPLIAFPSAVKIILKILVGILMCVIASPKKPAPVCAAFFVASFVIGGGISALVSLPFSSEEDGAYLIYSPPAGVIVCFASVGSAAIAFGAGKLYSHARIIKNSVPCEIRNGAATVKARALIDSGNNFCYMGNPVSIISPQIAVKLMGDFRDISISEAKISTVTGKGKIKIIKADTLTIYFKGGANIINGAYLGISGALKRGEYSVILNGCYADGDR